MSLMKGFAGGSKDVQGEQVVDVVGGREGEEGWAQSFTQTTSKDKGKGRAVDGSIFSTPLSSESEGVYAQPTGYAHPGFQPQTYMHNLHASLSPSYQPHIPLAASARTVPDWDAQFSQQDSLLASKPGLTTSSAAPQEDVYTTLSEPQLQSATEVLGSNPQWEEDEEDAFRFFNGPMHISNDRSNAREAEMEGMVNGLEAVGQAGKEAEERYVFQPGNPWLRDGWSQRAGQDGSEDFYQGVLKLEAEVLNNPTDAVAWFELGVKQQENEVSSFIPQRPFLVPAADSDLCCLFFFCWLAA